MVGRTQVMHGDYGRGIVCEADETICQSMFNPSRAPGISSRPATLSQLVTVTPAGYIQAFTPFHHHLWGADFGLSPLVSSLGYMRAGE